MLCLVIFYRLLDYIVWFITQNHVYNLRTNCKFYDWIFYNLKITKQILIPISTLKQKMNGQIKVNISLFFQLIKQEQGNVKLTKFEIQVSKLL